MRRKYGQALWGVCMTAALLWAGAVWGGAGAAWAADAETAPVLIINDELYAAEPGQASLVIRDERVYVPLRVVSVALGYEVQWLAESNQVVIAQAGQSAEGVLPDAAGKLQIVVEGSLLEIPEDMGSPFVTNEGFTMLPLRAVGEALSCEVHWEPGLVAVTQKAEEPVIAVVTDNPGDIKALAKEYYNLTIFGEPVATQAQIEAFFADKEKELRQKAAAAGQEFVPFPENIAGLYLELGEKYHIRGDIALAQALKETGYFQFQGSVEWFQNNYCGLGATGIVLTGEEPLNGVDPLKAFYLEGMHGLTFAAPAYGVEAHLQHLYAYATKDALPAGCTLLDPRFSYVQRGVSPRWIDLDGHWAVPGDGYGESILDDYWQLMARHR